MAQKIKQANIFGRIGSGIGQGLAEQIPKEIERGRLASGLKQLEGQKDLSPFQQFSRLAAIPGITPQMIQSGSDLLRQQARGQALIDQQNTQNQPRPSPFPEPKPKSSPDNIPPSLTKEGHLEEAQKGNIPPSIEERDNIAGQAWHEKGAGFFNNDPQKAIEWADEKIAREQAINEAHVKQHERLSNIQDNVVNRLQDQYKRLGAKVPSNVYSDIEDEAIQATKPKKDGGQGLTEQAAMKLYGKKLDDISREYSKLNELSGWSITSGRPSETLRTLKGLQEDFEKRKDTENAAQTLIANGNVSPKLAYGIFQPVSKVPSANKILKDLPKLPTFKPLSTILPLTARETLSAAEELAPLLTAHENLSPLSVAYELEKKGYDPQTWLQYVTDNKKKLNLRERQANQLDTRTNIFEPWNDWWLNAWSGIE